MIYSKFIEVTGETESKIAFLKIKMTYRLKNATSVITPTSIKKHWKTEKQINATTVPDKILAQKVSNSYWLYKETINMPVIT